MVTKPAITRISIPGNKFTVGRSAKISQISEHHAVGDASQVIAKAQGDAIFSTTFTISLTGQIFQLVDEANTPYCDNDFTSNSRSLTIEHGGGLLPNFPYTDAMYDASIRLHAWLFQTYGPLNCVRHRDIPEIVANPSKATACPGGLDVERIVIGAKALLGGTTKTMTNAEFDTFIAETYQKVAARKPSDAEFDFHRKNYAEQGDKWCLAMVKGFKGDDVYWTALERNLNDATVKIANLEKDATPLEKGKKYIVP